MHILGNIDTTNCNFEFAQFLN